MLDKTATKFSHVKPADTSWRSDGLRDFSHHLVAHASGQGFLMGDVFGVVAIIAAVVLINVKKDDVPAEVGPEAMAGG